MTTTGQPFTTLTPTASPLRVAARLAVLTAVCAALAAGFVASLAGSEQDAHGQVARVPAACSAPAC